MRQMILQYIQSSSGVYPSSKCPSYYALLFININKFQSIQKLSWNLSDYPVNYWAFKQEQMRKDILSLSQKSFEGILPFSIGDWLCNHHDEDPSHLKASVYLDPAYLSPYLSRHISPPTEYLSDNSQAMHRMCLGAHTNIQCIANKMWNRICIIIGKSSLEVAVHPQQNYQLSTFYGQWLLHPGSGCNWCSKNCTILLQIMKWF